MSVLSICVVQAWLPKTAFLPRSEMGTIIWVQPENKAVSQHLFNPITMKAIMAGVELEQRIEDAVLF